jgi:hypothetical protein
MAATLFRYTRCAARFMSGTRKTIDFVPWMFPRRATRSASDFRPKAEDCLTVWSGSDTKSMDFVPWNEMVPGMVLCTGHVAVLRGPAAEPEILLLRHNLESRWSGSWDLPGGCGTLFDGQGLEGLICAARRKASHDCNRWQPLMGVRSVVALPSSPHSDSPPRVICIAKTKENTPAPLLAAKFESAQWFHLNAAIWTVETAFVNPELRQKKDILLVLRELRGLMQIPG